MLFRSSAATIERIEAQGRTAIALPLFAVTPLAWATPDPADFDALLLTSANAVRLAGPGLAPLAGLPVHTVGPATAEAARHAGLTIVGQGDGDGAALIAAAEAAGVRRALLLAGRERKLDAGGIVAQAIAVYASDPLAVADEAIARLAGSVALLHSPRAGARLAELVVDRSTIRLAAISRAAADAAGPGWGAVGVAARPDDDSLIAVAAALAD